MQYDSLPERPLAGTLREAARGPRDEAVGNGCGATEAASA